VPLMVILGLPQPGSAQSSTYGLGKTPTAEEIRSWDIAISPTGKELPPGSGSAKEGAPLYAQKCAALHGATGDGGRDAKVMRRKSRIVQPRSSSRQEEEARKKARRSTPRNVRHATEQRGTEDGLLS